MAYIPRAPLAGEPDAKLAHVVAHESAHLVLGHQQLTHVKDSHQGAQREADADELEQFAALYNKPLQYFLATTQARR